MGREKILGARLRMEKPSPCVLWPGVVAWHRLGHQRILRGQLAATASFFNQTAHFLVADGTIGGILDATGTR